MSGREGWDNSSETRNVDLMLISCWPNAVEAGPTANQQLMIYASLLPT